MQKKCHWLSWVMGVSMLIALPQAYADPDNGPPGEDAILRVRLREKRFPTASTETMTKWDAVRKAEALRWRDRLPGQGQGLSLLAKVGAVKGQAWVNIGPTDALVQYNGSSYFSFDTGRPNNVLVDPRDANVVYFGSSGGGVWKSYDFLAAGGPTWVPVTDGLTDLAVGAMAIDASQPDVLYVGSGDPYDSFSGGAVVKSTDGGATWSDPVPLIAVYPFGRTYRSPTIRDIKVDPKDSNNVLVAARAGLFRSTDAGKTFVWHNLPNGATDVAEATWSLAYMGGTSWVVSGATACSTTAIPPGSGGTAPPDATNCPLGATGDIWRSEDSGATWISLRNTAGALPAVPMGEYTGRITLAAGTPKMGGNTVVYAYVGNADLSKNITLGFWHSMDGGKTWKDATGSLRNPTLPNARGGRECGSTNLGHGQTWYNQALGVDPTNDDNVIAGGNLCSIRTLSGTTDAPVWENVSHWLPFEGATGSTAEGALPYAHADWHTINITSVAGVVRVFAGNDGGLYTSTNVFDSKTKPADVAWSGKNRGIVAHLTYAVGSGDPAWGNPLIALTGLQDNGTFSRNLGPRPSVFVGVGGGDGIGAAVNKGSAGTFYWISSEFSHSFCVPTEVGCNEGGSDNWWNLDPPAGPNDNQPFLVTYAPVLTDPTGVGFLTQTDDQVWLTDLPAGADPYDCSLLTGLCKMSWKAISPDFSAMVAPNGPNLVISAVAARKVPNLYGAVLDGENNAFAVTSDGGTTWTVSSQLPDDGAMHILTFGSSLDFPLAPSAGKMPGDEYVAASSAPFLSDFKTPVPDSLGHIFLTADRGKTWTAINGSAGMNPLPNMPIYVVKYDPIDPKTIYAGTLIGVYATYDSGANWERLGSGLPMVQVTDMYVAQNQDFIRISTYGRGLWEIYPSDTEARGASGDGDYDRNLQLDWVDLAALSSRLGTNPATVTPPLYTYVDDITSDGKGPDGGTPVAQIDDNDLTALLGKFGGHP